jgi:hypothetical protein
LGIDRRSARKVERPQADLENRASGFVNHAFVQSVVTIGRQAAEGVALRARKARLVGLAPKNAPLLIQSSTAPMLVNERPLMPEGAAGVSNTRASGCTRAASRCASRPPIEWPMMIGGRRSSRVATICSRNVR